MGIQKHNIKLLFTFILILLISCGEEEYVPKPIGYIRTDLPTQEYSPYQLKDIMRFDLSDHASIDFLSEDDNSLRFNIVYPKLKAKIHLAYNRVHDNLGLYMEETRKLTYQHHEMANDIEKIKIDNTESEVYGFEYKLSGDVASASQFFITDKKHHFLRGALYFWARPNEDSLAPSLEYIRGDINRLIESVQWREVTDSP